MKYKKSSFSADRESGTRCVEVAIGEKTVFVRHSNLTSAIIEYTREEWKAFIKGVKQGEFDIVED